MLELNSRLTDDDDMAHAKRRHRIKMEKAGISVEGMSDASAAAELELELKAKKMYQIEWAWDSTEAGPSCRVSEDGLTGSIGDDDEFGEIPAVWEYSSNSGRNWTPVNQVNTEKIEQFYKRGELYGDSRVRTDDFYIYPCESDSIKVDSYMVSGFNGHDRKKRADITLRRSGIRLVVRLLTVHVMSNVCIAYWSIVILFAYFSSFAVFV